MAREFVPFDEEIISGELDSLRRSSSSDAAKLDFCMERFEDVSPKENPSPAMVESFKEGFRELRHENGSYKGRSLFYQPTIPVGTEELVMLAVFRKETQKTPTAEIKKAVVRMELDVRRRAQQNIGK